MYIHGSKKTNWKIFPSLFILAIAGAIAFYLTDKDGPQIMLNLMEIGQSDITDEELKEKIGQMIMIGFRGTEVSEESDIYKTIKDVTKYIDNFEYNLALVEIIGFVNYLYKVEGNKKEAVNNNTSCE